MFKFYRPCGRVLAAFLACSFVGSAPGVAQSATLPAASERSQWYAVYDNLKLRDGRVATVYANGVAVIHGSKPTTNEYRTLLPRPQVDFASGGTKLPDKQHAILELEQAPPTLYAASRVVVVLRPSVGATRDTMHVATRLHTGTVPDFTNDMALNRTLAKLGADSMTRLFQRFNRSLLSALHERASDAGQLLDFSNAYVVHVTNATVRNALIALSKSPSIAYVEPDWTVRPMHTSAMTVPPEAMRVAATQALRMRMTTHREFSAVADSPYIPDNYADSSSAQSMLNAPGSDAVVDFDEINRHFHQLPGQGEIITNVSEGDVDDAGAASNPSDPCSSDVHAWGPTTELIGGQHYIDWPSMPLIPAYTVDSQGNLSGNNEVCGVDPELTEVGLDFSVMAPLPHELQRNGEQGSGLTDLLGIAPGAHYRLIVPSDPALTISDVQTALLAAALQTPQPNVITASIGYSLDQDGFPSRYLEDDPLTESIVAGIVKNYDIAVCIAGGDGTRILTGVAIGPSGGSAPTDVVTQGETATSINDISQSTTASLDFDSGSIDAGGTTLDDITTHPPLYASEAAIRDNHTWPETRWTGFRSFSSAFGTRVNLSAPADNILAVSHTLAGAVDAVSIGLNGGTSASAPEAAAAAAVALQVARLTGHPFESVTKLRAFLRQTGTAVPNVPQADVDLNVGPQLDVRRAVETLIAKGGKADSASVPRVAIEQRRDYGNLDAYFLSDTDPSNIDLQGSEKGGADGSDLDKFAWITIAPDWEFAPSGAKYRLFLTAKPSVVLARTPDVRLLPETILSAAGLPLTSGSSRTVKLAYEATMGAAVIAKKSFSLTFGPADATSVYLGPPDAPSLVTGSTIPVRYDLTNVRNVASPSLIVSYPGRVDPGSTMLFNTAYRVPLPNPTKGVVQVPVSALHGGGVYGIGIEFNTTTHTVGDFAFTRVQPTTSTARPEAPLLAANGSAAGHFLEIPLQSSFQVHYDVGSVPGATGAILEISAPGPGFYRNFNPFNNPNGNQRDDNGVDTGSVYDMTLAGTRGTVTLSAAKTGLVPTLYHVVRVLPTKAGVPFGEASDVSSITLDGIVPPDGGAINFELSSGWGGINVNGNDGLVASSLYIPGEVFTSDLYSFDQTTGQILATIASTPQTFYSNAQIFANDLGLVVLQSASAPSFGLVDPVATASSVSGTWTPKVFSGLMSAANQTTTSDAFLAQGNGSNFDYYAFSSDPTKNTFSSAYDLSTPMMNSAYPGTPTITGFAENTTTNTAVAVGNVNFLLGEPITIATVNLTTGAANSFKTTGFDFPGSVAVDSGTNEAAFTTYEDDCVNISPCSGINLVDLASQTGKETILGGFYSSYIANDPGRKQFLVDEGISPDFATNNNTMSSILVYNEQGRLLKSIEKFNEFAQQFRLPANYLLLNTNKHIGFFLGLDGVSLEPFAY